MGPHLSAPDGSQLPALCTTESPGGRARGPPAARQRTIGRLWGSNAACAATRRRAGGLFCFLIFFRSPFLGSEPTRGFLAPAHPHQQFSGSTGVGPPYALS